MDPAATTGRRMKSRGSPDCGTCRCRGSLVAMFVRAMKSRCPVSSSMAATTLPTARLPAGGGRRCSACSAGETWFHDTLSESLRSLYA